MDPSNDIFSNQDELNQLQYDLLSFPFPTENTGLSAHETFSSTFLNKDLSTDNVNLNYNVSAPSDYSNTMNISSTNVSFLPQNALSTPMATPGYSTPLIHPHQEEIEVKKNYLFIFCFTPFT
jgi:hypothetical protein